MSEICYKWDDAIFSWLNADVTWVEACAIAKAVAVPNLRKINKKDKAILIKLVTRLKMENDNEIEINSSKVKNKKAKVTIEDVEIFIKEIKNIKVNVII